MTTVKMKLSELREHISGVLCEVNFWNSEYFYDPRRDSVEDLAKAALRWFHYDKPSHQYVEPTDSRFVDRLRTRMRGFGISDHVISKVISVLDSKA